MSIYYLIIYLFHLIYLFFLKKTKTITSWFTFKVPFSLLSVFCLGVCPSVSPSLLSSGFVNRISRGTMEWQGRGNCREIHYPRNLLSLSPRLAPLLTTSGHADARGGSKREERIKLEVVCPKSSWTKPWKLLPVPHPSPFRRLPAFSIFRLSQCYLHTNWSTSVVQRLHLT